MSYHTQPCISITRGAEMYKGLYIKEKCFVIDPEDDDIITFEIMNARKNVVLTKTYTRENMNEGDYTFDIYLTAEETATLAPGIGYFRAKLNDSEIIPITTMYVI